MGNIRVHELAKSLGVETSKVLSTLEAMGVKIYEPTADEKAAFQKAAAAFYEYPEIKGKWTPGLYERVKGIIAGTGK